ncbi:MAG: hypothetical protein A2W99_07110 [Bacteroidetes bacterium GWF2_33_16]|nr:MAG: hypothetical protein A2X00_11890 [Bacteroidetes bacterium GWE2_32_14]OFY03161.1 MAG: hypothetical protein A2W99_07110 [Bacteroidetes bacterium GWF2_33_16]
MKKKYIKLLFILSFVIIIIFQNKILAQNKNLDPNKAITQYRLRSWTIEDGLPSNAISHIIQSKNGYIWIATYGGVSKFDGVNFTNYSSQNSKALLTEAAKVICEDMEGVVWIGTQKGIVLFKDNKLYREKSLDTLNNSNIESIFVDSNNKVWIGTENNGLFNYEKGKLRSFDKLSLITTNSIYSIYEDNEGNIWIGTIKGELIKYKDNRFTPCDMQNLSEEIYSFYQDTEGILWAATSNGVYTIVNDKLKKHHTIDIKYVENINEDKNGNLWFSSNAYGLYRYNKATHETEHLSEKNGLPNNRITKIIFDNQGSLWGGTYRNGLFQITDGKFTSFSESEGLFSNINTAIMQYSTNEFWVANEKGTIDIIRNGQISKLKIKTPILSPQIKHMFKDSKENIWISTYAGLIKIGKQKEQQFNTNNGFPDNYIRKTFEDSNGNIWVASNRTGIHKIKTDGSIYTINTNNGLSSNYVMTIVQYKADIIIAGTKRGINFIRNDSVINQFTMDDGLPDNMIFNIYKDKDDILWISTNTGISRFENNNFTNYSIESGLQTNNVYDIVEDNFGYFWMPGPTGIMKVSIQQLNDFANKKIDKISYTFYDKSDGMKSSVCLGATESLKDLNGNIWFLTAEGIAKINPGETAINKELPLVYIEQVFTSDSIFDLNKIISINPKFNRFNIKYTAIDLVFPEKVLFKYKLEPFENEWIDAENKRMVSYTNLDPGNYTFKVRSTNSDDIWNENYVSISIKILPAWYQTLLFKVSLIVFVFCVIFLWIRFRIYRIKNQRNILEKLVEERTYDLQRTNKQLEEKQADLEVKQEEIKAQAEHLELVNDELEKHKEHLEKLVKERTEDLEKAKERAEESDRLKSAFLANMSHEIRTPMNAIIGFSNLLVDAEISDQQKKEMVIYINNNTNSLLKLIEDIICISKIESGEVNVNMRKVNIQKLLNEIYEEFEYRIESLGNKSINFILDTRTNNEINEINSDLSHLKQVLKDLLDNAFKFTEKGEIHYGYEIVNESNIPFIKFYVKDTGIGISSEQQKQLFKRFMKAEVSKQKLYRGAGLGLVISKNLVEIMGGRIWVESNKDKGSTFYFTLPIVN